MVSMIDRRLKVYSDRGYNRALADWGAQSKAPGTPPLASRCRPRKNRRPRRGRYAPRPRSSPQHLLGLCIPSMVSIAALHMATILSTSLGLGLFYRRVASLASLRASRFSEERRRTASSVTLGLLLRSDGKLIGPVVSDLVRATGLGVAFDLPPSHFLVAFCRF
jgi:hypothetical protein